MKFEIVLKNRESWGFFEGGLMGGEMIRGWCKKADKWGDDEGKR